MQNKPPNTEKWKSELFFIFACVGAAVGLGNLWRFPYMAYQNGGGAFFFPYLICLLFVGIPLVILEIGVGRWTDGTSVASAFKKVDKKWTWIGWWALINSLVIVFYYTVVIGWGVQYIFYSFSEMWGDKPDEFFMKTVLGLTDGPYNFGSISISGVIALAIVWCSIYLIVRSGTRGLSKVLLVTVPLPLILLIVLAVRALGMPGATEGVSYLFTPRFNEIFKVSVWSAAASQVVLSLGLGMGQIVAYANRKRDDSNIVRSGISISLLDLLFSIIAGVTVFATMGFLASKLGVGIADLKLDGLFLSFVSYPMAISTLPFAPIWGIMFFVLVVSLGIDSAFAVIEANLSGFVDLRGNNRQRIALWLCAIGFLGGIIFSTGSGLYWLDIVDHWVSKYSIASIIILQCIVFANPKTIEAIKDKIQPNWSDNIYKIWKILLLIVLPISLIIIFGKNFLNEFSEIYGGYPLSAVLIGGWGVFISAIIIGIILSVRHNKLDE
jgi:NSS family neurotransmitter:Na+ symporter